MKETNVLKTIQLAITKYGCVLFRNNVGKAWQGQTKNVKTEEGRAMLILEPRIVNFGLTEGSSDLIGWTTITIAPEYMGKKIAVFTAIEGKRPSGRATKQQVNFLNAVRKAGGFSGIANNPDTAVNIISKLPGFSE